MTLVDASLAGTLSQIVLVVIALQGRWHLINSSGNKAAAYLQDRLGPNRVGPWGLFQPIADGAKFILKEEIIPAGADKILFLIAPVSILATATIAFATIPFGYLVPWDGAKPIVLTIAPQMDIGILFVFAISSLGVYGVVLGGWASNSKYSFLGGLRSSAQLISYELPLGLSVIGVVLFSGSLRMETIINQQAQTGWWWFAVQPLAFIVYLISGCAECTRLPFDLPECEQERIAQLSGEYLGMKFGMFALIKVSARSLYRLSDGGALFRRYHHRHFLGLALYEARSGWRCIVAHCRLVGERCCSPFSVSLWVTLELCASSLRSGSILDMAWKTMIPLGILNLIVCCVTGVLREQHSRSQRAGLAHGRRLHHLHGA